MTANYTRCKTVRFELATWSQIEVAAGLFDITTSEYIRTLVRNTVAKIDLKPVLPEEPGADA